MSLFKPDLDGFIDGIDSGLSKLNKKVKRLKRGIEHSKTYKKEILPLADNVRRELVKGGDALQKIDTDRLEKIGSFGLQAVSGAVVNTIRGAANTLSDAADAVEALSNKDTGKAGDIFEKRVDLIVNGTKSKVQAAGDLAGEALESCRNPDKTFLTEKNSERLSKVLPAALALAGLSLTDDAEAEDDADDLPSSAFDGIPVEHGMFAADEADLQNLIARGEIDGTEHIAEEGISRDMAARSEFLRMNGYDEAPEGYEVHHVHPLCEGGPDTPDNMILVSEEEHDAITAEHAKFYGWHSAS
jgi:hypothetical protein